MSDPLEEIFALEDRHSPLVGGLGKFAGARCEHDTNGDGDCHRCVGTGCPLMPSKPGITNTTKLARGSGFGGLAYAMPGAIEKSEEQGQKELAVADVLPTQMSPADKAELEKRGVVFGKQVDGDPLFTNVTLPKGWKKKGSGYWTDLLDEKGQKVGSMFYKAAFYDRDAFFNLAR